ncbi:hypothetical protein K525DRAFT_207178 [Schizophyllum commune Loenen D]|nr:hypothetical protein K525DRAFT_207178 [Schizophyllum commune Loenen D]
MPVYMRGTSRRAPDRRYVPFTPSPLRQSSITRMDTEYSSPGARGTSQPKAVTYAAPPVANCMTAQIATCTVPQLAPRAAGKMLMSEGGNDGDDNDDFLNDPEFLNDLTDFVNGEDEDDARPSLSRMALFKEQPNTFASFERSYSVCAEWHEKEMTEFQDKREKGLPLVDDIDAYHRVHGHRARCAFSARDSGDFEKYQARKVRTPPADSTRMQARAQAEAEAEARAWLLSGGVVDEAARRARLRAQRREDKSHPIYRNRQTWKRRYEAKKAAEIAKARAEEKLAQERGEMSEEEAKKKADAEMARKARADKRACDRARKDAERARKLGHAFPISEKENVSAQNARPAKEQENGTAKTGQSKRQRLPAQKPTRPALLGIGRPGRLRPLPQKPTPPTLSQRNILGFLKR